MKITYLLRVAILALLSYAAVAQPASDLAADVDDFLSRLPVSENREAQVLFNDLMGKSDGFWQLITDRVVPNGDPAGINPRYAVSLLTHYATEDQDKRRIERLYLRALERATSPEVQDYFLQNLTLVGSDVSIDPLKEFLDQPLLADRAIGVLTNIGSPAASAAIVQACNTPDTTVQARAVKAIGDLRYKPALSTVNTMASSPAVSVRRQALWTLAILGDAETAKTLQRQAQAVNYREDASGATESLIRYLDLQSQAGNAKVVAGIAKSVLAKATAANQQHVRLAALRSMATTNPNASVKVLIKELERFDDAYRRDVLQIALLTANSPDPLKHWQKVYEKSTGTAQADIFRMLTVANRREPFVESILAQGLRSPNQELRVVAAEQIGIRHEPKLVIPVLEYLLRSTDPIDIEAAQSAALQLTGVDIGQAIAPRLANAPSASKVALIEILGQRRCVEQYGLVAEQLQSSDEGVRETAFRALANLSTPDQCASLLELLSDTQGTAEIAYLQEAIANAINEETSPQIMTAFPGQKVKILPLLPYVGTKSALERVTESFFKGSSDEQAVAFSALERWQGADAIRIMKTICSNDSYSKYRSRAFEALISQVINSKWPDDQKLLMLREVFPFATNDKEKNSVLRAAGTVRTFLSLMFVADYLDDPELSRAASRSAMQIALPTADAQPGLAGLEVRKTLNRTLDKLAGADSQYERIDILTYLENMPYTKGYESIFNGEDLSGWQGLVENPIARSKMSAQELSKKQKQADEKVKENWSVKEGCIYFQGEGANLCTRRMYGDFEMLVDWKISKNGDSGIYLRGSPQVQIWDIARTDVGAQVGSGGLYNNEKAASKPLTVADNPVGEWNTFRIRMIGDRVTVYLNGIRVVDSVVMENYWDRSMPIFPREAIELQAHGTELAFRNLYVRELDHKPYQLTKEEIADGYELLFNGQDLDQWVGNKTEYVVEDNAIAIYPAEEAHGNLYTTKEYSDFVFRFEFQLTPGANNGLGIHAPLSGDAAYVGKEIQILDNTAAQYANLQAWQYHGSVYGVIPARTGYLRPVGDWNMEEVRVKGDSIKVWLNGTLIMEGDVKMASKNGTLDHKDHPGLDRHTGHIGFLGHGTVVRFRNIRIKDLTK